ncbi:CDGSH iron-sulfur domain-containing protein [Streptomyces physcomitrii]|uniref:CDGSH iron-sulfur domain-containing protein n=1 Tax=Streptomyces physcomitrii TaxID=2724184 RepID=A0ABX1H0Q8_9ACTN|nr:CDGSH iron-sulfur domain-containing protein [Streptomyces physcomitrii]
MVEGPVEFRLPNGETVRSDRFMVAICTCRHSAGYPWCDTSHRRLAARQEGTAKWRVPETDRSTSQGSESRPEKPQKEEGVTPGRRSSARTESPEPRERGED